MKGIVTPPVNILHLSHVKCHYHCVYQRSFPLQVNVSLKSLKLTYFINSIVKILRFDLVRVGFCCRWNS